MTQLTTDYIQPREHGRHHRQPLERIGAHGAFCLGYCWALMVLLFVLGVMSLLWVIALTLLVLAEKSLPGKPWLLRISVAGLCGWSLWLLGRAALDLA